MKNATPRLLTGNWTSDLWITRHTLYQLSYRSCGREFCTYLSQNVLTSHMIVLLDSAWKSNRHVIVEILKHLLATCSHAKNILAWYHRLLSQYRQTILPLTPSQVLFGHKPAHNIPAGFAALLGLIRHRIWVDQNFHRFDGIQPDPISRWSESNLLFVFCYEFSGATHSYPSLSWIGWPEGCWDLSIWTVLFRFAMSCIPSMTIRSK